MLRAMPTPSAPVPPAAATPAALGLHGDDDRCPGALRLHAASDGHLARIRLPGGRATAAQLAAVGAAAAQLGDGRVHLTSRGSVQLRGLDARAGQALAERLTDAGLLPSLAHDRVRNVVASPLAGLDDLGRVDIEEVLARLDALLCASPRLTALSGRFLFGLDDGRGDVLGLGPDVAAAAEGAHAMRLWVGGEPTGRTCAPAEAAAMLVEAAGRFLALRDSLAPAAWRVADLDEQWRHIAPAAAPGPSAPRRPYAGAPELGLVLRDGSPTAVCVGLPLGEASPEAWAAVVAVAAAASPVGGPPARVTAWRRVVLGGLSGDAAEEALAHLAAAGLLTEGSDPLAGVSACAGRPGCASSRSDPRADVRAAARELKVTAYPVHVSGCERRCGHPAGTRVEAVATAEGRYAVRAYDVAGVPASTEADVPPGDLGQALARASAHQRETGET
jgi:precorrin-3B synthase